MQLKIRQAFPDAEKENRKSRKNVGAIWGLILCLLGIAVAAGNLGVVYNSAKRQAEEMGNARLQQISNQMQKTLDDGKIMLLRFAADVEVLMDRQVSQEAIQSYLKSQSRIFRDQSEHAFINAYVCTDDWILVSDSSVPDDYVFTERGWYSAAMNSGIENIYITAPYSDAFTDGMCFTTTMLLPDGHTIVAIDFNLSKIQQSVAAMNREGTGEALIVSRDGIIVGCNDQGLAGEKIEDALPEYVDVYTHLLNEQNDSIVLDTVIAGQMSKVYCNRSGEWLMLYKAGHTTLIRKEYLWVWLSIAMTLLLLGGMFLFFMQHDRKGQKENSPDTEEEIAEKSLLYEKENGDREKAEKKQKKREMMTLTKGAGNGIMPVMLVTVLVAIIFTGIVLVGWGNDRMEREVDSYNYQLEDWTNTQLQTLNLFVDSIAANPAVLDDYDFAVEYLDRIVQNYSEISAAYIARPGNEHEMTMNNGWVPNADYVVAERQWYVDTQNSETGINVSTPYLDARTGLYCVTFSRIVNNAKTGERIGIFALDFYIGNQTAIMESSYSGSGYAFLIDNSNIIVNHPNETYQISPEKSMSIVGTEYDRLLYDDYLHFIRDYDGKLKVGISRTEDVTGFTVVSVKNIYAVYGIVLLSGGIFIFLLIVCIVLLYQLIIRMIRWQEKVRQTLTEEAERASRADRAKSSFLAQMSHEIRTPISAVLGMNEMILRESKEEAVLEYASNAYNAGKALLSIINDILDISKIEAGKLEITNAEYELYSLVSDCYHMMADRAEKKGLELTYTVEENLPVKLFGDMFHIRQIIVNLLTNAIKYTDEGKVEFTFSGKREEGKFALQVSVKDTGIGLSKESMEKLFESFQRFDLKRNQSVEGTGLGLSICKQLAVLMGGEVTVESVYGQGSTFTCILPQDIVDDTPVGKLVLNHPAQRAETETEKVFMAKDARLLVVDDVEMNLIVFRNLLKGHGFIIDEASSGKQCLELVQKQKYDAIFMDHMMPEMDGVETFARMGEMEHLNKDTPVIMLTANAIIGEKEKYMAAGFTAYLTKPIQSEKLEDTLAACLPEEKVGWEERKREAKESSSRKRDLKAAEGSTELLDKEIGLSYTGNSEDAYQEILTSYVKNGEKEREALRQFCEEEAWPDYIIHIHALKSTSLTVGAKPLSLLAAELEHAGKTEDYGLIRGKNEEMLEQYEQVLKLARELLRQQEKEKADAVALEAEEGQSAGEEAKILKEMKREQILPYIEKIQNAADGFDSDEVLSLCDELSAYTLDGVSLREIFAEVRAAAADFEYERAKELAAAVYAGLTGVENHETV